MGQIPKVSGIYKIESVTEPRRVYIGSSVDIHNRERQHFETLKRNVHKNPKLQAYYNKYGKDGLIFSLIAICDREDLIPVDEVVWIEQCFIWAYKPWFNVCPWAGRTIGVKKTGDLKRFGVWNKGRTCWCKGLTKETNESLRIMSENRMGVGNPMFGKELTKEHRDKISEGNTGRPAHNRGILLSQETKDKVSESLREYWKRKKENKVA